MRASFRPSALRRVPTARLLHTPPTPRGRTSIHPSHFTCSTTIRLQSTTATATRSSTSSDAPPPHTTASRHYSSATWRDTLANASKLVAESAPSFTLNPATIVASEMQALTKNIQDLLSSRHPSLDKVAKYYIQSEGKHLRPLVVLLMARATCNAPKVQGGRLREGESLRINSSITPTNILQDFNPAYQPLSTAAALPKGEAEKVVTTDASLEISPSQKRLAEITEMIHAASLLHDDVIDNAETRRGEPSGNLAFGNKMAILAGDFLLGRASVALARLRDAEVIELLATVIANLVEGEFMQLNNNSKDAVSEKYSPAAFEYYIQKTYLKSASLISKSCRAAALLGGSTMEVADAAYLYGKNLGLSFQLIDDMLDYTVTSNDLGKPAQADLKLGLATAPALFAWEQFEELGPLIQRKFSEPGDVEMALTMVQQSNGLEQTRALATSFAEKAISALASFPDSEAKEGLIQIAQKGLTRKK